MTHIYTAIHINRNVEDVFQFVTAPVNWPKWHPSSLRVYGNGLNHSMKIGEQITEEFKVAGIQGLAVWKVMEHLVPYLWVIEGSVEKGGGGTLRYTLTPQQNGVLFEREFTYEMSNFVLKFLNSIFFRYRIKSESTQALRKLKQVMEGYGDNDTQH